MSAFVNTAADPQPVDAPEERVDDGPVDGSGGAPQDPDDLGRSGEPGKRAVEGAPYVAPVPALLLLAGMVALTVFGGLPTLVVVMAVVVMIFFHELGHFVMARRAGMKVTEFMIGFGPRIASFRRGEVEYGLKAIPAGAYVKIIGMAASEEVAPGDEDRTYRAKRFWPRIGVAVAGSAMHFMMALVLLFVTLTTVGQAREDNWRIGTVVAGSSADQAGLREGDRLLSLDGTETETFADMSRVARASGGERVDVVLERDGEQIKSSARIAQRLNVFGTIGEDLTLFENETGALGVSLSEGGRIAEDGLSDGDVVVAIDGVELDSIDSVVTLLERPEYQSDGGLELSVVPAGGESVTQVTVDLGNGVASSRPLGFFGVGQELVPEPLSVGEAIPQTFRQFANYSAMTLGGMARFFTPDGVEKFVSRAVTTAPGETNVVERPTSQEDLGGENSPDNGRMMSIVGAVRLGADNVDSSGWMSILMLLIALNIAVGILNLLPFPPLDGGHVVIAIYERIREALRGDGERYLVDSDRLVPIAVGVVLLMGTLGLLALYLDLADPVKI